MPYANVRFGDVTLPERMVTDDLSTGQMESALIDSIGGAMDYYGSRRRTPRRQEIVHVGQYVGETIYLVDEAGNYLVDEAGNYLIAGNAAQMLQAQVDALKAMLDVRDQLWRQRDQDGVLSWKWARLLMVRHLQGEERVGYVAKLEARFETQDAGWRAETATTHSATLADATPTALNVENGGEATIYDAVLTVHCLTGTLTAVSVASVDGTLAWSWAGSLAAAHTLVVNDGAQTVQVDYATDSYSGFSLGAGHTVRGWLPLEPGLTPLLVTVTGGTATAAVSHYAQVP